jgi:hypothetical protein
MSQEVRQELEALMMIGETLEEDMLTTKKARRRKEAVAAMLAGLMPGLAAAALASEPSPDTAAIADPYEAYLADSSTIIAAESSAPCPTPSDSNNKEEDIIPIAFRLSEEPL